MNVHPTAERGALVTTINLERALRRDDERGTVASPRLLTIEDVSRYLGVSERWIYQQVRMGRLPAMLIASRGACVRRRSMTSPSRSLARSPPPDRSAPRPEPDRVYGGHRQPCCRANKSSGWRPSPIGRKAISAEPSTSPCTQRALVAASGHRAYPTQTPSGERCNREPYDPQFASMARVTRPQPSTNCSSISGWSRQRQMTACIWGSTSVAG